MTVSAASFARSRRPYCDMLPDTSKTMTTSFGPLEAATYQGRIRGSSVVFRFGSFLFLRGTTA